MRLALVLAALISVAGCKSKDHKEETMKAPPVAPAKADSKEAKGAKAAKAAATQPKAKAEAAASASKVECKLANETRTLEVRAKDKGCETAYTKGGQENVVGSSQNGTAHCEGIMNKIKDKLASAGYTCQ